MIKLLEFQSDDLLMESTRWLYYRLSSSFFIGYLNHYKFGRAFVVKKNLAPCCCNKAIKLDVIDPFTTKGLTKIFKIFKFTALID